MATKTKTTKTAEPTKPVVDLGIAEEDDLEPSHSDVLTPAHGFSPRTGDTSLVAPVAAPQKATSATVAAPKAKTDDVSGLVWIVTTAGYVALAGGMTPVGAGTILRSHTHDMDAFHAAKIRGQIAFEVIGGGDG